MSEDQDTRTPPLTPPTHEAVSQPPAQASPGVVCRHCGSEAVRRSQKQDPKSGFTLYRCRACKHHFKVKSTARPRLPVWLAFALSMLLFIGVAFAMLMRETTEVEALAQPGTADTEPLAALQARAGQGDARAQLALGQAYWHREQHIAAVRWLNAAAEKGQAEAQYLMGQAYLYGRGTVQSYRAAFEQFSKAAKSGYIEAEYQLGIFHRDGLAGTSNKETAYAWLNVAAAHGHAEALLWRDKLTAAMTGEELLRAQAASAEMLKRQMQQGKPPSPDPAP